MDKPDCNEAATQLYSFLDGHLTDDLRVRIQRHLDDCSPCLEAFDFEAELRQVIAQRCRDTVPQGLLDRIASALDAERGG